MRPWVLVAIGIGALAGARGIRELATSADTKRDAVEPYAPSPDAAPFLSGGYRELTADLMFARLTTYVGGLRYTPNGVASLCEAIEALDPHHRRAYEWCALAIKTRAVDQSSYLRAVTLLEHGLEIFPDDWQIPNAAGEIYLLDLQTKDPEQRRKWDERAAQLFESATRKPNAPSTTALNIAQLRTKLGQHQRAIDGLKELLLTSQDDRSRRDIIDKLAELEKQSADALAGELLEMRHQFEDAWHRERPALWASMYVLLGPHRQPGFDMGDLATGGHGIAEPPPPPLEPVPD
jgi:tetratricopeptide (TPR) repeat protein